MVFDKFYPPLCVPCRHSLWRISEVWIYLEVNDLHIEPNNNTQKAIRRIGYRVTQRLNEDAGRLTINHISFVCLYKCSRHICACTAAPSRHTAPSFILSYSLTLLQSLLDVSRHDHDENAALCMRICPQMRKYMFDVWCMFINVCRLCMYCRQIDKK